MAGRGAGVADLRGPRLLNADLSPADLKAALARQAQALGFDGIGVTAPDAIGGAGKHFRDFLEAGGHGDMDWLAAHPEHPALPHLEDDAPSAVDAPGAQANAALDATDPGALPDAID